MFVCTRNQQVAYRLFIVSYNFCNSLGTKDLIQVKLAILAGIPVEMCQLSRI